ncbi:MAG TPA: lysylphosphatidylglycerol synthase transmembrane domain-containing protein [Chloroflexia bacterium]|nr:lysylphosphatidylglycerol synthase transmembrane domain-containing protein [Chloroflexia bacterium]
MKHLKFWVGLIISVLAVWFAVQGIEFGKVGEAFSKLNWWLLALSMIPYFISLLLKVTRWQLLFHPGPKIPLRRLWATLMISYLFNTVLPARLGEIVRGYTLSKSEKIGTVRVLSTILLEKILDVMTMFVFLVFLLPFLDLPKDLKQPAIFSGVLMVTAFVICILMAKFRKQAESVVQWFLRFLPAKLRPKIFGLVEEVLDVLSVLLNLKLSFNIAAQSVMLWLLTVVNYMLTAFALNIPLTFELAMVLMIALNLGMVVPSAPGYIGVFESLVIVALLPFFPDQKSMLFNLGLLLHIIGYLPVIVLGAYYTWREGISFGNVPKEEELEKIAPAAPIPVINEKETPSIKRW